MICRHMLKRTRCNCIFVLREYCRVPDELDHQSQCCYYEPLKKEDKIKEAFKMLIKEMGNEKVKANLQEMFEEYQRSKK